MVHNRIIENHEAMRERLKRVGYEFASDTDTEVIAHLVDLHSRNLDLFLSPPARRWRNSTAPTPSPWSR